jgi:dipeptidyl aminopeptidase/acylaminoacyl peptidase
MIDNRWCARLAKLALALTMIGLILPTARGTAQPPPNGVIHTLEFYARTDNADYYRMVYWSGGLRISGFYAEPRSPGRHPAVIYNRGGNRGVGALRGNEFAAFAEAGYVVAASQYRGGPGAEGRDELGGVDVDDVLSLIPLLRSRAKVDPDRIAIFGSSRGALMTYIALRRQAETGGHDIRVAATTSGLTDLIMWARERPDLDGGVYLELMGANTRTNRAALEARSATYWPELIRVPLLIVHGDADTGVSVQQSRRLYEGIRAAGGQAELIVVRGGDHGLTNHDAGMPEVLRWFQTHLARGDEDLTFETHAEAIRRTTIALRRP